MARASDFDLGKELARPGFTPGQRDIPALVALVIDDEAAAMRASPALAGLGADARAAIVAGVASAEEGGAARLVAALGLHARAGDRDARAELLVRVGDARVRVRRAAIVALGKLGATRAARLAKHSAARGEPPVVELREDVRRRNERRAERRAQLVDLRERERRGEERRDDSATMQGDVSAETHPIDRAHGDASGGHAIDRARGDVSARTPVTDRAHGDVSAETHAIDRAHGDASGGTHAIDRAHVSARSHGENRADVSAGTHATDDLADVRAVLLARWDAPDVPPDERRALAEALGKIGGEGVRSRLLGLDAHADRELARRRDRALLVADREAKRGEDSSIAIDVAPPMPLVVRLGCRPALSELLMAELRSVQIVGTQMREDAVDVPLSGPWSTLFASRLWATAAIRVVDRALADARGDRVRVGKTIVHAITSAPIRELLRAWTRGPIRWRLQLARGHQRAVVWTVAKDVTRAAPELLNDPTLTTWDVRVDDEEGVLELVPRRVEDPRFAYRVAEVPAASHPSVAAAVVWLAGVRAGERVWDPFCGSGLELVEAARRGAGVITGSDIDDDALAAARANLEASGLALDTAATTLANGDARTFSAGPVDAIITNPPLGSRVHLDAGALLADALPHFTRQLAPAGRLVWITPQWRRTTPIAEAQGLVLVRSLFVDLGGVRGRLERWDRQR